MELETRIANELATGAPGIIRIGGKERLIGQPLPQEMATIALELANIHKRRRADALMAFYREFKDMEVARTLVLETLGPAPQVGDDGKFQLNIATMMSEAGSLEGARFIAYMMLRQLNPDVTPESLREEINEGNAAAIGVDLLIACGLGRVLPNSPGVNGSTSPPATTATTPPSA